MSLLLMMVEADVEEALEVEPEVDSRKYKWDERGRDLCLQKPFAEFCDKQFASSYMFVVIPNRRSNYVFGKLFHLHV
jgi:hypothetical protein